MCTDMLWFMQTQASVNHPLSSENQTEDRWEKLFQGFHTSWYVCFYQARIREQIQTHTCMHTLLCGNIQVTPMLLKEEYFWQLSDETYTWPTVHVKSPETHSNAMFLNATFATGCIIFLLLIHINSAFYFLSWKEIPFQLPFYEVQNSIINYF